MKKNTTSSSNSSLILIAYPLSASFERAVRDVFGEETQTVTIAQLRSLGVAGMACKLWSTRVSAVILPVEEVNSAALLPVLKILAAFVRSRSIYVVHPDLRRDSVSRLNILADLLRFAAASISCLLAAHRARRELKVLLSQSRGMPRAHAQQSDVLYLKTNLWFGIKAGGSVGHISGVVNGFQRLGYPVIFASAEPPVMFDDGVNFLSVQPPTAFGLPYELNNYRFQRVFEQRLESDTVLTSSGFIYQRLSAANYLGAVLSRRHRLPLVVEYNGSEVWVAKHWGRGMKFQKLAEMAEEAMLLHAHLVVTVSDVLKEDLIERGVEPNRIVMYPNCVDPSIYNPDRYSADELRNLRRDLKIPNGAVLVTFVGTFGQWHGAEKLAHTIVTLYREEYEWLKQSGLHFLFVGDGLTRLASEEIINSGNAGDVCTFAGLVPQADAPMYLAASDILVSPHVPNQDGSRFFGSPTKLFEYMAMGKPIIASSLEQIAEVINPSLHVDEFPESNDLGEKFDSVGLLVEPSSGNQLAESIKALVNNRNVQVALGKNSRIAALQKYTWDRHVNEIIDALGERKIIENRLRLDE